MGPGQHLGGLKEEGQLNKQVEVKQLIDPKCQHTLCSMPSLCGESGAVGATQGFYCPRGRVPSLTLKPKAVCVCVCVCVCRNRTSFSPVYKLGPRSQAYLLREPRSELSHLATSPSTNCGNSQLIFKATHTHTHTNQVFNELFLEHLLSIYRALVHRIPITPIPIHASHLTSLLESLSTITWLPLSRYIGTQSLLTTHG